MQADLHAPPANNLAQQLLLALEVRCLKPKLYLETTVPSYLTAWPSRDLIRASHQQITREWSNAEMAHDIERVCREFGLECPVICTPEGLMGG